jgi:hypothetical protein
MPFEPPNGISAAAVPFQYRRERLGHVQEARGVDGEMTVQRCGARRADERTWRQVARVVDHDLHILAHRCRVHGGNRIGDVEQDRGALHAPCGCFAADRCIDPAGARFPCKRDERLADAPVRTGDQNNLVFQFHILSIVSLPAKTRILAVFRNDVGLPRTHMTNVRHDDGAAIRSCLTLPHAPGPGTHRAPRSCRRGR